MIIIQEVITIEWLAALVSRQREHLVQQQVQKLQIQQAIQASDNHVFNYYPNLLSFITKIEI